MRLPPVRAYRALAGRRLLDGGRGLRRRAVPDRLRAYLVPALEHAEGLRLAIGPAAPPCRAPSSPRSRARPSLSRRRRRGAHLRRARRSSRACGQGGRRPSGGPPRRSPPSGRRSSRPRTGGAAPRIPSPKGASGACACSSWANPSTLDWRFAPKFTRTLL
jgi:hypothetical protein